jgi:hypothetical protein
VVHTVEDMGLVGFETRVHDYWDIIYPWVRWSRSPKIPLILLLTQHDQHGTVSFQLTKEPIIKNMTVTICGPRIPTFDETHCHRLVPGSEVFDIQYVISVLLPLIVQTNEPKAETIKNRINH